MQGIRERLKLYYLYLMLDTRSLLGLSPCCFGLVQRMSPTKRIQTMVGRNTDLCIEAPSGSGNSYFVNGFRMINPDVRLANHHHVAAQVTRGVHYKVPTVAILRDPLDCVVSRTAFWNAPLMAGAVFIQWIRFFRAVEQVRDHILLASFESVTGKPEVVIKAINDRFGTAFNSQFPPMEQIAASMGRQYTGYTDGPEQQNPNLPSSEKESAKARIRPIVLSHRLARPACDLYARLGKTDI